ncbi:MAG: endonuclease/exonuclease/phosphatase family protein [Prolixibacteraceae bacterium]|nr:endonuclease/exonuclease/phosphatase family protein [Prolixibacteraceae bacterium]MDI9563398.1 endonuclease/exonuclease/phosphatase family protein [Bacteroidota bacterium]OQB79066.1 MAG: Endonuclease/Exonuclease/phosphatase family protein [Bacteroidetes bacterium ADurb.Bin123]HNZ69917.1 endonuclease/exonuclease/phosphatase family protein [Prolixibacteraceae bacterium]HOC87602.1 endonuclease/exonuclease/phosphatase family protein [Prolixibacteraceae bacterium]
MRVFPTSECFAAMFWFLLLVMPEASYAKSPKPMVTASYNIRLNTPGDGINAWPNRKEEVKALVRYHGFDIFGIQEAFIGQINDLLEMEEYAYTGHGRDDGKQTGEHACILYKRDRFQLLESGDFWLSETPDVPSIGWDGKCCRRICSWAKFRDKGSRSDFYFFCVHFDHEGMVARRESGKLMVQKIKEIAGAKPVICVGDFNSTPETEQIQTMQSFLNDAWQVTEMPPYGPAGTFNGFNYQAPLKERIDYVFLSNHFRVFKYGVLTDSKAQRFPSDHLPVVVYTVLRK